MYGITFRFLWCAATIAFKYKYINIDSTAAIQNTPLLIYYH
jgi:hypothetical protein